MLSFKDRAPWLVAVPAALLLLVSTFVMLSPLFSDGNRLTLACLFSLGAYLVLLSVKKSCTEIEFPDEQVRIKTHLAEHVLEWQQVSEIVIERKKRTIKLKTAVGDFVLHKTYGKMEELIKHLEWRAAASQIALIVHP
jgi:hypothetical protein